MIDGHETTVPAPIHVGAGTVRPRVPGRAGAGRAGSVRQRPLKYEKWRAAALISVYVLFGVHIAHWKLNGTTLAPLELNEVMYTLEAGIVTAGFLLMATLFLATAIVGRFFCSWACHILALEDLCSWLLKKIHLRPKPVRSRLFLLVPPLALFYMFVWPQIVRIGQGRPFPELKILGDGDGWASFVTSDYWRNLPGPWIAGLTFAVCGFAVIYFLGSRSFCFGACPYGAVFAAVDRIAPGRIKLTGDCEQCGICTGVCSSNVRVHEEIAQFGQVVDVNCMKDLDCVSACPQEAIKFGFTRPSPAASFSRTGRRRLKYDFSLGEEWLLAAVFVAVLLVFRGLYTSVPLLMTLGLGGIVSYLTVLCVRLVRRRDVRLSPFRLKAGGALTTSGRVFCVAMIAFTGFFAHSAFIRYHEVSGQRAFDAVKRDLDAGATGFPAASLQAAVHHLETARNRGLVRPLARDHQLASLHLKSDTPSRAEGYLKRIVHHDPEDTDSGLALAQLLAADGRWDEAETRVRNVIEKARRLGEDSGPGELGAGSALLGSILVQRGERHEAIAAYRVAADEDEANVGLRMTLGELLAEDERFPEAAEYFKQVTVLDPRLATAHYNLGAALSAGGDSASAIEAYRTTLALLPEDLETLNNLGFLLAGRGELDAAADHFRRALAVRPDHAQSHFNLGRILEQRAELDEAERHFRAAAELDPHYAAIYAGMTAARP